VARNTLANANAVRPWQIYADLVQHLIGIARPLYANEPIGLDLKETVYAFDATTIDLCLSVYPTALRRVVVRDDDGKRITFLTNNTSLAPETVGELYRLRWQVELFFKWIKQHLRIKAFFGTSENAVKTQIWIAVATYVLIAIVKKRAMLPHSLYELLQILSLTMFETTPINQLLMPPTAIAGRRSTDRSPMTDVGTLLRCH
jgi:hypothetical protein